MERLGALLLDCDEDVVGFLVELAMMAKIDLLF
jgi:hypothetical protein